MDFPMDDLPAFHEPFPTLHPTTFLELYELTGMDLAPRGQAPEVLLAPGLASGEGYTLPSLDAFAALSATSQNTSLPDDAVEVANVSMGPPTRPRKRKAGTLKAEDWEPRRPFIKRLHIDQGLPLKEVKNRMESEFGFKAEYRISQWALDRNVKPREMKATARKRPYRRLFERNKRELASTVRGQEADPQKIDRRMKRNDNPKVLDMIPVPLHPRHPQFSIEQFPHTVLRIFVQYRYRPVEEERLREDLTSRRMLYEPGNPTTLRTLLKLGGVFLDQGRYKSAEKVIREAVNAYSDDSDEKDMDMLLALGLLGRVLRLQGSYSEAATMQKKVLEKRKGILGDEHIDTIAAMSELAKTLTYQGEPNEVATMLNEVLEKRKRILGDEHPDTITAKSDLSLVLGDPHHQTKFETATTMQREVFEMRNRILGDNHPDTITAMSNFATTLGNQGEFETSLEMARDVLAKRNHILGDEHPDTITAMSNVALSLAAQGEPGEVVAIETMLNQVLEKRERILGEEHFDTITAMSGLALILEAKNDGQIRIFNRIVRLGNQDELGEAVARRREVLEKVQRIFGHEHYHTIEAMANLASSLCHQDEFDEAVAMLREALEKMKRTFGNEHPVTIRAMNNLAMALRDQGEFETAAMIQREVLKKGKRVFGEEDPYMARFTENLERILRDQKSLEGDSESLVPM
ncbi:hypothetical protein SAPIO_CDS2224 [Scedosporium apiospermum]|uniref:Clr5 domain-containing protein n=1 Tax=Pseudallescheria apiosperma TaxID=563466 RepID=A0A084GDH7_PSEDA|nr:uncharacterized protein SAPIO_CDS2224 [Scedosporium apiospermum]KEZ45389.1 hypothetical protein SAPIO_CDS2224 [Scedosporium apiospermum]